MKLILTTDDGIDAPGFAALARVSKKLGDPILVAPRDPQSGVGHKLTTKEPIEFEELEPNRFQILGTPADCARIALSHIAPDAAWFLAGINHGANLGVDVYTSGTVAAAREAVCLGYRAVSVSQYLARGREVDWDLTERRAGTVLELLLARQLESGCLWNVNLPHPLGNETDLELVFCPLDPSPHDVRYRQDGGRLVFAGDYHSRRRIPGRDVDVCLGGRIAVTPIPLDLEKPVRALPVVD